METPRYRNFSADILEPGTQMSIAIYGIYLAYPPTVDLRNEGLGRYLASFLKGASERKNVKFIIISPSWSHQTLEELFLSEKVPTHGFDIKSPKGKPYLLRLYDAYHRYSARRRKVGILGRVSKFLRTRIEQVTTHFETRIARTHSLSTFAQLLFESVALLLLIIVTSPLWSFGLLFFISLKLLHKFFNPLIKKIIACEDWIERLVAAPQKDTWILRIFGKISAMESERMLKLMEGLHEVRAWYSPTAFWPEFNAFEGPSVVCVPDVVLSDFPVGFSAVGGEMYLETFEKIETTIRTAKHLVTYSDAIKWNTLVDRYAIDPDRVRVIHHAPQKIDSLVNIKGSFNDDAVTLSHCKKLLLQAFDKSLSDNPAYSADFKNGGVKFLFYASQFRPNKNVINLLRAYEYLLRERFIGHKLILTGDPAVMPVIGKFAVEHNLENDVLCLHGLTGAQLAACYKLADLAVNPSLSEGGCPFTFSEALSVDTPVVMSRISVTEEVLSAPDLQQLTFFDPYDWKDIALRIEWAINNRCSLLEAQKAEYDFQCQRTWTDVANEHINFLEDISRK